MPFGLQIRDSQKTNENAAKLKKSGKTCSSPSSSSSTTTRVSFFFLKSNLVILGQKKSPERNEIHNEFLQYVNDVHWAGAKNLKSLYYLRSDAARNAENVNVKIPRINLSDVECLACEG